MALKPAPYNFHCWEGSDFLKRVLFYSGDIGTPLRDLTGYHAQLVVKDSDTQSTTLLTLSDPGNIIINSSGSIDILIPAATTSTFTWKNGTYELFLTSPDNHTNVVLHGNFAVSGF